MNEQTNKIPQIKLDKKIYFEWAGNYGKFVTARDAGEKIARFCHGLYDWQGVRETIAASGLKHAADCWLRKNNVSSGKAVVLEFQYGDGTSRYCPAWK
jgi:hypothetical protein